jgi:hypothetical protein
MADYRHNLVLLTPPVSREDRPLVVPMMLAFVDLPNGLRMLVHLLGRLHTIDAIAVTIPSAVPEEPRVRFLHTIFDHMISALRLSYDPACELIRFDDFVQLGVCYEDDNAIPSLNVHIDLSISAEFRVQTDPIKDLFLRTYSPALRDIIALFAEGSSPHIPPQYRLLSLIRALELLEPDVRQRENHLDRFETEFAQTKFSTRLFRNAIPELRNRCAHGLSRGSPNPIVGLGLAHQEQLNPVVAIIRTIVAQLLDEKHQIQLNRIEP